MHIANYFFEEIEDKYLFYAEMNSRVPFLAIACECCGDKDFSSHLSNNTSKMFSVASDVYIYLFINAFDFCWQNFIHIYIYICFYIYWERYELSYDEFYVIYFVNSPVFYFVGMYLQRQVKCISEILQTDLPNSIRGIKISAKFYLYIFI
ncbi:hypothetical protein EGR_04533 [Echinococcus granulosus]|uniref:Uncharacterized protein n=1 Tax=Echinococcus granulosus TaxID=6210 RepID=W6UGQ0_ECHGR|nr:hypothetical protein EGR_04533 [Echinococcus granulosus]EUB60700.1 hypothetical protein EGR_04533 [Echinococcus granulosus]